MCIECGCGRPGPTRIDGRPAEEVRSPLIEVSGAGGARDSRDRETEHDHDAVHDHGHEHAHGHGPLHAHPHREITVHEAIFAANDRVAERNRGFFKALNLLVLNVVSSPGSGKTTLLVKTIERLAGTRVGVIVGDLETDNDARRLRTTGAPVVQISTGTLCHLDAEMVARAVGNLDPRALDLLVIENVGNLVCPAEFDLGEDIRLALLSVTEGEDKPLKYPPMFRGADVVLVTKVDLAPHVDFDLGTALANIGRVSPEARIFEVSAKTGEGMDAWCDYLRERRAAAAPA